LNLDGTTGSEVADNGPTVAKLEGRRIKLMKSSRILVGLVGANIMSSLSPVLFAGAFEAAGIEGFYHLMDVDQLPGRSLPQLLNAARTAGFTGMNVTYPFKQDVIGLLETVEPSAREVGAVNTVAFFPDGHSSGHNFDRVGFRRSFEEGLGPQSAADATVVLVGAGGAGHAVAFALMDLGVRKLMIHDRDKSRAEELRKALGNSSTRARATVGEDLARDISEADGIVNATQVGMLGFPGNPIPISALREAHWAADVIYTPIETEFIKAAATKGARVLNGGGMCVHQAAETFRLLTGVEPNVEHLKEIFSEAVRAREAAWV
jgi:shikimate dehydrogenase